MEALEKAAFEHRDDKLGTVILAVLHENMDLLARLRERLTK